VPVLVMENADDAMDLAIFELVRLVQIQNVHLVDVSDGSVLICGSSLNEP
jgi:hypothetical protein